MIKNQKGEIMEKKEIRIQDDLYHFVNQEWIDKAIIPDDRSSAGGFAELDIELEKLLMQEFRDMASGKNEIPNENLQKAITLFKAGLDTKKRDEDGIKPLLVDLHKLDAVKDMKEFMENAFALNEIGSRLPFAYGVGSDMKDSLKHCFEIAGPSIILPDTTYYAEENEKGAKLIEVWKEMALKLMSFTDLSKEDQKDYVEAAVSYDKEIAKHVKSQLEWADYVKAHNPMSVDEVEEQMKPFPFKKFLFDIYKDKAPTTIIVNDPRALKEFGEYWNEETFPLFKKWSYVRLLLGSCGSLTEEMREKMKREYTTKQKKKYIYNEKNI